MKIFLCKLKRKFFFSKKKFNIKLFCAKNVYFVKNTNLFSKKDLA